MAGHFIHRWAAYRGRASLYDAFQEVERDVRRDPRHTPSLLAAHRVQPRQRLHPFHLSHSMLLIGRMDERELVTVVVVVNGKRVTTATTFSRDFPAQIENLAFDGHV